MKRVLLTVALMFALSAVGGFAQEDKAADETKAADEAEPKKYDLRYDRQEECIVEQRLSAEIKSVTMEGSPLGLEGWMKSKLVYAGSVLDEEKQSFVMRLGLDEIEQEFNGAPLKGTDEALVGLIVSAWGEVLGKEEGGDDITVMGSAGVPAELLALLAHLVRFSDQPVAVDEQWESEEVLDAGGKAKPISMLVTTRLSNVEDERYAWLVSEISLQVPSFKMPNPMGYGDPVPVKNAELEVVDLWRVFDMEKGVVVKAEGKVEFSAQVDMGGFPLNITAESVFAMEANDELKAAAGKPEEKAAEDK